MAVIHGLSDSVDGVDPSQFIHTNIWCNQLPCVADACTISFGSMPNLSNYANIFFTCYVCCTILEWVDFVHIWYSNQLQYGLDACKIYRGSVPYIITFVCL